LSAETPNNTVLDCLHHLLGGNNHLHSSYRLSGSL
jgi:hypothetical protein